MRITILLLFDGSVGTGREGAAEDGGGAEQDEEHLPGHRGQGRREEAGEEGEIRHPRGGDLHGEPIPQIGGQPLQEPRHCRDRPQAEVARGDGRQQLGADQRYPQEDISSLFSIHMIYLIIESLLVLKGHLRQAVYPSIDYRRNAG